MIGPLDAQKDKRYTLWRAIQPRKDIGDIASGQGKVSKRTRLTPFSLTTGYARSQADHIVPRRHKDLSRQGLVTSATNEAAVTIELSACERHVEAWGPCSTRMGHRKKRGARSRVNCFRYHEVEWYLQSSATFVAAGPSQPCQLSMMPACGMEANTRPTNRIVMVSRATSFKLICGFILARFTNDCRERMNESPNRTCSDDDGKRRSIRQDASVDVREY